MASDTQDAADYGDGSRPEPSWTNPIAYITRHPVGFWFIFWGELAERCAFYGIRALLFIYLTAVLGFADAYATQVNRMYLAG